MEYSRALLKGTFRYRIDPKGRLPVPAPFRRSLASDRGRGKVTLTVLDQCVAVYPTAEWTRLESQLQALPPFNKQAMALTRLLASQAAECELDVQGRILLPLAMRTSLELSSEVVIVGVLNRFEIWAPDKWDEFLRESERLLDTVGLDLPWPPSPALAEVLAQRAPVRVPDPQAKPKS